MFTQSFQHHLSADKFISFTVSLLAILFFALSLTIDSGYSYAPALLSLLALVCLPFYWGRIHLNRYHYYIISAFLAMSFFGALDAWRIHSQGPKYNLPARYLVCILLFLFLTIFPPKKTALLWGIAFAGMGAGLSAFYYTNYAPQLLPIGRAARYMNPIQFGNISIMIAMLCIIGLIHLLFSKRYFLLQLFLGGGAVGGLIASILSQSRGGWLAFCLTVIVFILIKLRTIHFKKHNNKDWLILFFIILILGIIVFVFLGSTIESRYVRTINAWQQYQQGNSSTSLGTRLDMWSFAWHEGWQYPFFGSNSIQMMVDKEAWVDLGHGSNTIRQFGHLHNEFLDAFATKGLFGLASLVWLFIAPLIIFNQGKKYLNKEDEDGYLIADLGLSVVLMHMGFGLTQVSVAAHNSGFMLYVIPICFLSSNFLNSIDFNNK